MQIRNDGVAPREPVAPPDRMGPSPEEDLSGVELTPALRAELLNPESWGKVLELYARTMKLAVALIDPEGRLLGTCHNPQPIWSLARDARAEWGDGCLFCLPPSGRCAAAADALRTGRLVLVHDQAGFAHVAVPLSLGDEHLGVLIAGQIFDRYPEQLPLQRVAKAFGLSAQQLWNAAVHQAPISRANLTVYGDLLCALGQAFLRERYGAILEKRLAETNRQFRLLVDSVKDYAIFTVDATGLVSTWNSGAEHLLGYTEAEILGRQFSRIFTREDVQNGVPERELQTAAREGRAEDERWHVRKDGSLFFVSGILVTVGQSEGRDFGMILHDITERLKTEEAMRQAQKLESLGVLAGGIAHDFNNLLTAILGNASLILETSSQLDPDRPRLEDIVASSKRAAGLTNQLLAYAGKGLFWVTKFDLSELISEMLALIHTSIPKMVRLELALVPELPWIEGDASQIQQVVMNLVINAAEAIGPEGGTVLVSTGVTQMESADQSKPGEYVYMEVRDSGSGMDEATRARMFDPFFTTKFLGRGLGLAAVSGIIRGHKGRIQVESVPGEGTTFRISLPALESNFPRAEKTSSSGKLHGIGTILVVAEEITVLRVAKAVLEHLGYTVLIAENDMEAVKIFEQTGVDITAVLLDIAMPVMGGKQTLQRIRSIQPVVPILVSSGDSEGIARERFGESVSVGFIQKPYTVVQLAKKIKDLLLNGLFPGNHEP